MHGVSVLLWQLAVLADSLVQSHVVLKLAEWFQRVQFLHVLLVAQIIICYVLAQTLSFSGEQLPLLNLEDILLKLELIH